MIGVPGGSSDNRNGVILLGCPGGYDAMWEAGVTTGGDHSDRRSSYGSPRTNFCFWAYDVRIAIILTFHPRFHSLLLPPPPPLTQ